MSTIVLGAGMAGIAAAHDLQKAGESVILLEARDRIGGRVYTSRDLVDFPVELGAELIHGNTAPHWLLVQELGLRTLHWPKQADSLIRMADGRLVTMTEARLDPLFDITRSWALPDEPVLPGDETLATYLTRIGFTPEQLQYVRRSFANATGEDAELFSAAATLLEITDTSNGEGDYRIAEGQITLIEHLAQGLDIRLNTVIQRVSWSETGVQVSTDQGEFTADRAIITLPLGVLKAGKVAFEPALPAEKQAAIDGLGMGTSMKLVYVLAESPLPREIAALYSDRNPPMWWTPSFGRETDQTVWTAFVSGSYARELLALGEQAALQHAFEHFRIEVGRPDLQYVKALWINWPEDPFCLGGYSIVPPGAVGLREQLAASIGKALYWAGEATALRASASTVHGAYSSGKRAAGEIISAL